MIRHGSGLFLKFCKKCGETWGARTDTPKLCAKCHSPYWDLEKSRCPHCDFIWSRRKEYREPGRCPKCRKLLHKSYVQEKCLNCGYNWTPRKEHLIKNHCPRCQKVYNKEILFLARSFPVFDVYKEGLGLIWPRIGLTKMAYLAVEEYLRSFCFTSVAKKLDRSRERIRQILLKTEKKLYSLKALNELREALRILGKSKEAEQVEKYLQCRKGFMHICV